MFALAYIDPKPKLIGKYITLTRNKAVWISVFSFIE